MGHFVLVALGSSGDVNPFLGMGVALRARGHRTTLLSAPQFAGAAASVGAEFHALGTAEAYDAIYEDPDLWHPRRGLRIYFSYLSELVGETVRLIERQHDSANTAVLASFQCFGARVAQEVLGLPLCTVLPYPISLQSAYDPNRNPIGNPPRWMGRPAVRLMYRLINWEVSRHSRDGIEQVRRAYGLDPPISDVASWSYSPRSILGRWPSLFSSPQPDWPPQARTTGFISYDGPKAADWNPPDDLPDRGDWLVFTPGTQMTHGAAYFRAACQAAEVLDRSTLMVASDRSALPTRLPPNVRHLTYVPFSWLFERACAVVHHGGIGTAGRALEAGVPQLIIPRGFDQFDNAQRVVRIGAGSSLDRRKLNATSLASVIDRLLTDEPIRQRCREIRAELTKTDPGTMTCEAVERLLVG
jgi:UDP:flavonoid glycosyltransferase YjiC (YdhE family)